jgi:hypothetical protein
MYSSYIITLVLFQTESQRKGKLQRSSKLLFIFLETLRHPFTTVTEAAPQSLPGTRADLHEVEAAEEGLLLGE